MKLEELEKLVLAGDTPRFEDVAGKMNISIQDFNAAVSKFERQRLIDLGIVRAEMKPISRSTWNGLSPEEQVSFGQMGGSVVEDQEHRIPKDQERMANKVGESITRGQWDSWPDQAKADWSSGQRSAAEIV